MAVISFLSTHTAHSYRHSNTIFIFLQATQLNQENISSSIYPTVCLTVYVCVYLSIYLFVCPSVFHDIVWRNESVCNNFYHFVVNEMLQIERLQKRKKNFILHIIYKQGWDFCSTYLRMYQKIKKYMLLW